LSILKRKITALPAYYDQVKINKSTQFPAYANKRECIIFLTSITLFFSKKIFDQIAIKRRSCMDNFAKKIEANKTIMAQW
jgi:hypothetical protein